MASDSTVEKGSGATSLKAGETIARLAGVGVILLGVVGAFLYLGGWLTPQELTARRFTTGFEQAYGEHSGFRRNHAKGVGVSGHFDSNGNGARISKAIVFQAGRVPLIGRFSLGGGDPYMADSPDAVRAFALEYNLADGEQWRTAMIDLPVFPFRTPQDFYENMMAGAPDPETGKPDPAKMSAWIAKHPEFLQAIGVIKSHQPPVGFEDAGYFGLNTFIATDASGKKTPVRWWLEPGQTASAGDTAAAATNGQDKNYLFDGLIADVHEHPLQWKLMLIVGQPGDATNDPTVVWPDSREEIDAGTVTIDTVVAEETSPARVINFDPLILPAGLGPSDDPFLSARSAVYSQSFTRRTGERVEPSAVTPGEVQK